MKTGIDISNTMIQKAAHKANLNIITKILAASHAIISAMKTISAVLMIFKIIPRFDYKCFWFPLQVN